MNNEITLEWTDTNSVRRQVVLEPRSVGGWHRIEKERRDGEWRLVGEEIVSELRMEAPAGVVNDGVDSIRGP